MNFNLFFRVALLAAVIYFGAMTPAFAMLLQRDDAKEGFPQAVVICKIKFLALTEPDMSRGFVGGASYPCTAQCEVVSVFKGKIDKKAELVFNRGNINFLGFEGKIGETCLVMINDKREITTGIKGVEKAVEPVFGEKTGDRLLAEFVAMCKSDNLELRLEGLEQLGELADRRGGEEATRAAKEKDVKIARAGIIAQYRLKIPPDVVKVAVVLDEEVMSAAYEEAGLLQEDEHGENFYRVQTFDGKTTKFLMRGMPDFDYAGFVREGIKVDWVRKDEHTLYSFFGVPWKSQRPACVPELISLLEHSDKRVRWWVDICLTHTVYNIHEHATWEDYQKRDAEVVKQWQTWWKVKGADYMTAATKPWMKD